MAPASFRTVALLQRIVLETRITLACHVKTSVPASSTMRLVVMILNGDMVKATQKGVTIRSRINMAVRAGRVVALVGVRCVLRKSVISRRGSIRTLHLPVNSLSVSTISSSVF